MGVNQLQEIEQFLSQNPNHLQNIGRLPRSLTQYQQVYYLLVAQDHWRWIDPVGGISIVEYEALKSALSRQHDLRLAIEEVLAYRWLPVEGADFEVRYERVEANGVSAEAEAFFPI